MAPIHPSKDVLYRNDKGAWVPGRRPARGETVTTRTGIPFSSTAFYYANIIDYGRVALSLVALYFILQAPAWRCVWGPGLCAVPVVCLLCRVTARLA